MSDIRRVGLTAVVVIGFGAMLVGTSKPEDENGIPEDKPAPAASVEKADDAKAENAAPPRAPAREAKPPETNGWTKTDVKAAKVSILLPPGVSLDSETNSERYFKLDMVSGYQIRFGHSPPLNFKEEALWYAEAASGFDRFVFEDDDALVVARNEKPYGEYWEASACSKEIDGGPWCETKVGPRLQNGVTVQLTNDEAMAVVAMARSIEALK